VHELVEDQAARKPAAIAAVYEGKQLTYAGLNERANQMAHRLRGMGVGPDTLVAIYTQRGLDMLIGLLAILKAGGAYLPLDPIYPAERIDFIMQDARVAVLLTQSTLTSSLPANGAKVVELDTVDVSAESRQNPRAVGTAEDLAYVIYTSGSTGKPKGVQIPHRAVVNFLTTMRCEPGLRWHFAVR